METNTTIAYSPAGGSQDSASIEGVALFALLFAALLGVGFVFSWLELNVWIPYQNWSVKRDEHRDRKGLGVDGRQRARY